MGENDSIPVLDNKDSVGDVEAVRTYAADGGDAQSRKVSNDVDAAVVGSLGEPAGVLQGFLW